VNRSGRSDLWARHDDEITNPRCSTSGSSVKRRTPAILQYQEHDFPCAKLVSYVSNYMTLLPGDIITPEHPPVWRGMKPTQRG